MVELQAKNVEEERTAENNYNRLGQYVLWQSHYNNSLMVSTTIIIIYV